MRPLPTGLDPIRARARRVTSGTLRLALVGAIALAAVACGRESGAPGAPPGDTAGGAAGPVAPRDVAVLHVKDFGEIRFELFAERAPKTVASFAKLAREGFYEGTTFHRVIPGFMIQGGDPNSKDRDPRNDGMGGPGFRLEDERNETSHVRGIVSMANTGAPHSGGSQFFILVADRTDLDGGYTAFGRVVAGLDVADRIANTPRDEFGRHGPADRPRENVVIERVEILPAAEAATAAAPPGAPPTPPDAAATALEAPAPTPADPPAGSGTVEPREAFRE